MLISNAGFVRKLGYGRACDVTMGTDAEGWRLGVDGRSLLHPDSLRLAVSGQLAELSLPHTDREKRAMTRREAAKLYHWHTWAYLDLQDEIACNWHIWSAVMLCSQAKALARYYANSIGFASI